MTDKRPLRLDDLLEVEYLSAPALSPDGRTALYVVNVGDRATGNFSPRVWTVPVDGGEAAPLLEGDFRQKLPRFSPDGTDIFFLSDEEDPDIFQIWRLRDGKRTRLTTLRHGVSWYSVSADGKKLAFEAPLWLEGTAPETGRENALELLPPEKRAEWERARKRRPIVIEELAYKFDETYGIPDGSVQQLGTVDLETGRTALLTWEPVHHRRPVLSPGGEQLACWRFPNGGWKKSRGELTVYSLADGSFVQWTDGAAALEDPPVWQGGTLLYGGYDMEEDKPFRGTIWRVDGPGRKPVSLLPEDAPCFGPGALLTGHTAYGYPGECLQAEAERLLFLSASKGTAGVYALENGGVSCLTPEKCCVHGFASAGSILLCVKGAPKHIADLCVLDRTSGKETRLTRHNAWMDQLEPNVPQEMTVPSADGKTEIHGWVLKPAGFQEGKTYPAVLDIHGGPECCYPYDWWFEFQYLAARGMAVVWCDPRGSISYGAEFQEGAWGGEAYSDLMTFLDAAVALGFIDPDRCGVTGGSYGGYMTNRIIGSTDRFAAAVTQRSLCNRATSYGTGDMGSLFEGPFRGAYHSLLERMRGRSTTLKSVDNIRTPTLILHATSDYRCSFEQGEQMFIALKDRCPEVPVRFAAFLGENHGLTREGNLYAQRGHLKEMADWFDRFLNGKEDA